MYIRPLAMFTIARIIGVWQLEVYIIICCTDTFHEHCSEGFVFIKTYEKKNDNNNI